MAATSFGKAVNRLVFGNERRAKGDLDELLAAAGVPNKAKSARDRLYSD